MKEALLALQPKNIGVIFTFMEDADEGWDQEFAMDWLTEIFEDVEMPCPAQGNIFLFKGRDKNGVPATRSEEITAWVRSIIHREAEHVNDSRDAGVIALLREENAMFRKMIESQ